ncbi:MAG: squalene--hopene cyclase [Deltaproteobacteria bacterium]|nr:MAG: squalene--hopene cyclase [Deltaproteobacteria bacterium]
MRREQDAWGSAGRGAEVGELARAALDRAVAHLLSRQNTEGWWKGELETNVTMDAEDLLMREFLGIRTREETALAANWIRNKQREDGSWATYYGGPADLSTTVEAYAALRLAGDPPEAEHMKRAREVALGLGGTAHTRVFTRIWLALFGEWSWDDLPALPPEVILLPAWFPLNVYDFACWARQTIVPLTIVGSHRPVRPLPFSLSELRVGERREVIHPLSTWKGRLQRLDRALRWYERHPIKRLRELSRRLACEWILQRQEADGSWGGIQPPWVYSVLALHLEGYPLDHPALARALHGFRRFTIEQGDERRLEACQSPVWDTALAMIALRDAGVAPDHPALVQAAEWTLREEVRVPGDWCVRRPHLEPSGWAFEFDNDRYPDVDDTAEVILALRAARTGDDAAREAALARAIAWTVGMQSSDGGFAAFDADNTRALCRELPFCDFGEVIDPPSADVTAHVVEMLALEGRAEEPRVQSAVAWLLREQEPGGSWFGRWGANHVYGTGAVVPALIAAGLPRDHIAIRRAVRWLSSVQNADGGFGEDLRSYTSEGAPGLGDSTASQTAWALLALLAAGERGRSVERAVEWLARTQRADGSWDEPQYTGTGFPRDFYINYHLYRLVFPIQALGRYVSAIGAGR